MEKGGPYLVKQIILNYIQKAGAQKKKKCTFIQHIENYERTNKGHGWIGVRFQHKANKNPNEIILHVNLHEITLFANMPCLLY